MKKILFIVAVGSTILACNKPNDASIADPPVTTTTTTVNLSAEDLTATNSMRTSFSMMQNSMDSMLLTPHHSQQLHWDSVYHHNDSLFWHHHNVYHHGTYTHDDHGHSWVPYDTTINHTGHHHHQYPGHPHDSLIITHNSHLHDNTDHHFTGHDMHDHHVLDSLHHQHQIHHP